MKVLVGGGARRDLSQGCTPVRRWSARLCRRVSEILTSPVEDRCLQEKLQTPPSVRLRVKTKQQLRKPNSVQCPVGTGSRTTAHQQAPPSSTSWCEGRFTRAQTSHCLELLLCGLQSLFNTYGSKQKRIRTTEPPRWYRNKPNRVLPRFSA